MTYQFKSVVCLHADIQPAVQICEKVVPTLDRLDREKAAAACFEALGSLKGMSLEWTTEILALVESLAGSQKATSGWSGLEKTLGALLIRCGARM